MAEPPRIAEDRRFATVLRSSTPFNAAPHKQWAQCNR
jgi:hypothetical protein